MALPVSHRIHVEVFAALRVQMREITEELKRIARSKWK